MPEGDTLYQLAAALRPVLSGETLVASSIGALTGLVVRSLSTRGKHLLLHLGDDTVVHVHLGMTGRFFVQTLAEAARRPAPADALVLDTATHRVVGVKVPVVEHLTATQLRRHPQLSTLGPDILSEAFDVVEAAERFRRELWMTLGEALIDQRLVCGVGNVYKSEALFLERLDPWRRVGDTAAETLVTLLGRARDLMRRNLDAELRRTRRGLDPGRYHVYGRSGEPCLECETVVAMARQGDAGRSTYYCPACQGVARPGNEALWPGRTKC